MLIILAFSNEEVDCFIKACNTGSVDKLNEGNFKDVYKMLRS